ncbi:hypothetical protein CGRA01v4_11214 [Colletotrichum graminicola]|nr:hypothetical protein CGRA01v4_11214 [Colletotrichum graminicola]
MRLLRCLPTSPCGAVWLHSIGICQS